MPDTSAPRDTTAAAARVQIEVLRQASLSARFQLCRALSRGAMELAHRALCRAHPEADDTEIKLLFIHHHYGSEIAREVRAHLARRRG